MHGNVWSATDSLVPRPVVRETTGAVSNVFLVVETDPDRFSSRAGVLPAGMVRRTCVATPSGDDQVGCPWPAAGGDRVGNGCDSPDR